MAQATYQLQPLPQPLVIFDHMMTHQTQTIVLKEKLFDNFDIKGLDKAQKLHVEGQIASLRGRKKVYDPSGRHLFDIIKRHFHWHATFSVMAPNEQELMQVKSKFNWFGSKANATFTTNQGQAVTLAMKGDWLDMSADIVEANSGVTVARIDRRLFNMREAFLGHQTYHVTIAPGVDMALIAAMCICLDEKQNESGSSCSVM